MIKNITNVLIIFYIFQQLQLQTSQISPKLFILIAQLNQSFNNQRQLQKHVSTIMIMFIYLHMRKLQVQTGLYNVIPPPTHTQRIRGYLCSTPLSPTWPPPPPPISGIGYHWQLQNTPFPGLSREIFPRQRPQNTPYLWENGNTHAAPLCRLSGGGGYHTYSPLLLIDVGGKERLNIVGHVHTMTTYQFTMYTRCYKFKAGAGVRGIRIETPDKFYKLLSPLEIAPHSRLVHDFFLSAMTSGQIYRLWLLHESKVRNLNYHLNCAFWITQCTHERSNCDIWITQCTHERPNLGFSIPEREKNVWVLCQSNMHGARISCASVHAARGI